MWSSKRFAAYRHPVNINHSITYLLQFGTTERIRAMLRLLTQTKFLQMWQLAEAIESVLSAGMDDDRRIVVAPLGDRTGSTAIINYLVSHSSLAPRMHIVEDLRAALRTTEDGEKIYFVDDCLLSGTQTINIIGEPRRTASTFNHVAMNNSSSAALIYCLRPRSRRVISTSTTRYWLNCSFRSAGP